MIDSMLVNWMDFGLEGERKMERESFGLLLILIENICKIRL